MLKGCFSFKRCVFLICLAAFTVHAQPTITNVFVGTAFRYQGAIRGAFPNGFPQTGTLQFQFGLWDDPVNTDPASRMASNLFTTLNVSNGFFSTMLDFGDVFNGRRAFLEAAVYAPTSTIPASSNWVTVSPRTEIGAVPYAMWALKGGREVLRSEGQSSFGWNYYEGDYFVNNNYGWIPGGFISVSGPASEPRLLTNMGYFEARSAPKIVEEARVMVGNKYWSKSPSCLSCYVTVTLAVL